jgi:hypothetical protein
MTKQEILDLEQANSDKIHLLLEGSFWIAYEKSAFRFMRTVKPYKVKKKRIKIVECEMVSLGFPLSALEGLVSEGGLEIVERTDKLVSLRAPDPLTDEEFELWKTDVELFAPAPKQNSTPKLNRNENDYEMTSRHTGSPDCEGEMAIVRRIRDFSVENSTPMECLLFVAELKRQIREQPHNGLQG